MGVVCKLCVTGGEKLKPIIDVACGSKMFWFDKNNPNVEFCDIREVPYHEYYPKRYLEIKPDTVCDFTALPFPDKNWPQMIHDGFAECMRVLDDYGTLIFKWSEVQIPLKKVLEAIGHEPLFGHRSGKNMKTHWLAFMKMP